MHVDETASIILSEYNTYLWEKDFIYNKEYNAKEIKEAIFWNDPSLSGALSDIARLWKNNRDNPHTNLYYSLLRLWHIGFVMDSIDSIKSVIFRGVSLNFIFFFIEFYFLYLISRNIFNNTFGLVFIAIATLNSAAISNTMFIREYAMQEMLFVIFIYAVLYYLEKFQVFNSQINITKIDFSFLKKVKNFKIKEKKLLSYIFIWSIVFITLFTCFMTFIYTNQDFKASIYVNKQIDKTHYELNTKYNSFLIRPNSAFNITKSEFQAYDFAKDLAINFNNKSKINIESNIELKINEELGIYTYSIKPKAKFFSICFIVYIAIAILIIFLVNLFRAAKQYIKNTNDKSLFVFSFIIALCFLSGYFMFPLIIGVIVLAMLLAFICNKDIKFFVLCVGVGIVMTFIMYPNFLGGFLGYRGVEAMQKFNIDSKNIIDSISIANNIIIKHFGIYFLTLIGIFSLIYIIQNLKSSYKNWDKKSVFIFIFCIMVIAWIFCVFIIAPFKELRYVMSVFFIFGLLFALVLNNIFTTTIFKTLKLIMITIGVIGTILVLKEIKTNNIENLYLNDYSMLNSEPQDITRIIVHEKDADKWWAMSSAYIYLKDEHKVYFAKTCQDAINLIDKYKKAVVIQANGACEFKGLNQQFLSNIDRQKAFIIERQ